MKYISRFLQLSEDWLIKDHAINLNLRLFRIGVYLVLLLKMLFIWPELATFYRHVLSQVPNVGFKVQKLFFLPFLQNHYHWCWAMACGIVAFSTVYKSNRWLSVLVFIISLNYLSLAYLATNMGDVLLNFFVFSLIFIKESSKSVINQMFNNATLLMLKINLCFMYFINGYGKIVQKSWWNGAFMEHVWQLDYYANHHLVPFWFSNPIICLLTGWSVMLFELSFPLLIWLRTFRKWLIPLGLLFHIFIALFLSIPDFGLTVMVAYLLFIDTDKISSLKKR